MLPDMQAQDTDGRIYPLCLHRVHPRRRFNEMGKRWR